MPISHAFCFKWFTLSNQSFISWETIVLDYPIRFLPPSNQYIQKESKKQPFFNIFFNEKKAYIPCILLQMVYPLKSKFHFMGDHCPRLSHKVFTTLQSIHTKKESKNSHFFDIYFIKKSLYPVHFASNGLPSQIKVSFHGRPLSSTIP